MGVIGRFASRWARRTRFLAQRLWLVAALEVAWIARRHWRRLDPDERRRLLALVRKSKARPSRLNERERREAAELLEKLDYAELGGNVAGTIVIVEDITERSQMEEQLRISEKRASLGLLSAGVAHEVNTPLTGISSFVQMLMQATAPDDPKAEVLEKIERQTFRAAKIVNGLVNLSRPAARFSGRPCQASSAGSWSARP